MNNEFNVKQAVIWKRAHGGAVQRGVVVDVIDDAVCIVPVYPILDGVKCYDDNGAVRDKHQHNVRLRDCPPPFNQACAHFDKGLYAYADMDNVLKFDKDYCDKIGLRVLDSGICISDNVFNELYNHPWPDQMQAEKLNKMIERSKIQQRVKQMLNSGSPMISDGNPDDYDFSK